jgi:hypothetical protein
MRLFFYLLLALAVSMATETELIIFEQRDLGVEYKDEFDDLYITMDCETDTITIYVNSGGEPVTGAVMRLLYVDYSVPLLAAGPTGSEGTFEYKLVGERDLMTGLFLVVVEKEGFKNKEAHFDIMRCIGVEEELPEEEPEEELEEEIIIEEELPVEEEELPEEEKPPVANETVVIDTNITEEPEETGLEYICVPSVILLFLSFLSFLKQ